MANVKQTNNKAIKKSDSRKTNGVGKEFTKTYKEDGYIGRIGGTGFFGSKATEAGGEDPRSQKRLFIDLKSTTNIESVIEQCGCNWDAQEDSLMSMGGIDFPQHKGIIHSFTKKPLGIVGKDYVSVQPTEAMVAFDTALKQSGATYVAGGYINNGSRIFLIADLGKPFTVRKIGGQEDTISSRAILTTAFDGSGSYQIYDAPHRGACMNSLPGILIRRNNRISFPHTSKIKENIKNLITGMGRIDEAYEIFCKQMKSLQQMRVDKDMVDNFLDKVFGEIGDENEAKGAALSAITRQLKVRKSITDRIEHGMGNIGDTMFDVYNGVTEWVDYERGEDSKRNESWMFGSGRRLSQKALEVALEIAK